jgi:hypothetical protein
MPSPQSHAYQPLRTESEGMLSLISASFDPKTNSLPCLSKKKTTFPANLCLAMMVLIHEVSVLQRDNAPRELRQLIRVI